MASAINYTGLVISLAVTLFLLPLGLGRLFFHKNEFDRGIVYLFGFCFALALFELVYLPFFFLGLRFSLMTAVYFIIALSLSVWGWYLQFDTKGKLPLPKAEKLTREEKTALAAAVAVILWQVLRVTLGAGSWNVDDAWYLAIANSAAETDTILRYDVISGAELDYTRHIRENFEYIFCPWPLFWAMFAQVFHFHILIFMRTVMPAAFIGFFYYVMYRLLRLLFAERKKALTALAFLAVFYEFSAVAMNLRFTWIICYPWMGKGFGPSALCPLSLLLWLAALKAEQGRKRMWLGVFLANVAGCVAASSCAELNLILLGCWGLVHVLRNRDWACIWKLAVCVSPSTVLMLGHIVL